MASVFIFLLIGYILGSLSPGYFFGRIVKGVDLREVGKNKNTGASNTYREIGPAYGIITGIFDALKAAAAYWLAVTGQTSIVCWSDQYSQCGVSPDAAIFVGLAAVAGHIWPFYLKFRGGRGAASLAGLAVIALFYTQSWYALIFITGAIIYGMILNQVPFEAPVRKILKLGGLIFPLGLIWLDSSFIINIAAVLFIVFFVFDIARFLAPKFNTKYLGLTLLAKQKEKGVFSGYTLFLAGVVVVLKYFSPEIAIFTISAFIISDILAPAGKKAFLPIPFIKEKTVGGALVIFTVAVLAGIFINSLATLSLPIKMIVSGAVVMAILDQLSFLIDDNILVPIGTAVVLALLF